MARERTSENAYRHLTFGGGVVGLVAFLLTGLPASLVYGGFAGSTLAQGLLGHASEGSATTQAVVGFGMVVSLLAAAGVFVVAGAATGALGYFAWGLVAGRRKRGPRGAGPAVAG
jgi:hypothetical protein